MKRYIKGFGIIGNSLFARELMPKKKKKKKYKWVKARVEVEE
jgi:hypothetical protein